MSKTVPLAALQEWAARRAAVRPQANVDLRLPGAAERPPAVVH